MSLTNQQKNKKVFILALVSVLASVLFSFLGAPFLRAFSVSSKSRVFWSVATVLVLALFIFGLQDGKLSQAAVFVGAIWMTLGSYNELEKRGIQWRKAMTYSLLAGSALAAFGFFILVQLQPNLNLLGEFIKPIQETLNKALPDQTIDVETLTGYLPGIFVASLLMALALGFSLEARVVNLFQIQKLKVASALRWLEFRLPDVFIWTSLFALLFFEVNFGFKIIQTISVNILIIAAVALFFQGITVVEFLMRFYRFGSISKLLTYLLILFQLAPLMIIVGLVDYWADFRKMVRKKVKQG